MLILKVDLINNSKITTLEDLIKLFSDFKNIYNYIVNVKPSIPFSTFRQQNFYDFFLNHHNIPGSISSLKSKMSPHQMTIINDISRVFKLIEPITQSEKYNLVLTTSAHPLHDTDAYHPFFTHYASALTRNFQFSFESKFYVQHDSPPQDQQTFLEIKSQYIYIGKFCKIRGDRKIYRSINSRYYYVDHFHSGNSAQIEVFDSTGNHLGESSIYDDTILPNTADTTKKCKTVK